MQIDRPLRAGRAAVFAVACTGVSAAGHVWMSGEAIPAWAVLAALIAAVVAGYGLAGRQRGFASIAGLMLAGELGLHLLFGWAQHAVYAAAGASGMPSMSGMPGMAASGAAAGSAGSATWMSAHGSAGMVAVHAAAGLVCAAWLHRGEVALFRLLVAIARFAFAPLAALAAREPGRVIPAAAAHFSPFAEDREIGPRRHRRLSHAVVRRGPPRTPVFSM